MDDRDLRQDITFVIIFIVVIAVTFSIMSSKRFQEGQFMKDCGEPVEYCAELWSAGND